LPLFTSGGLGLGLKNLVLSTSLLHGVFYESVMSLPFFAVPIISKISAAAAAADDDDDDDDDD